MTTPQPQLDMGRVAQRTANAVAGAVADLGTQLAMAQEVAELRGARVAELEQQLEAKTAELARSHQVADQLQQRVDELENPGGGDGKAIGDDQRH